MSKDGTLGYRIEGAVAHLTIDRPAVMNAVDGAVMAALDDALRDLSSNRDVRVAVLSGAGGRAFSAGIDLKALATRPGRELHAEFRSADGRLLGFDALRHCPKPVIAAIDGYCLGAGLELALCCDIRVCTAASQLGLPEPRWSLLGGPGLVMLPRLLPAGEAMRWQLTGGRMGADRAYQLGLVQAVCADRAALDAEVSGVVADIVRCAPLAVEAIKDVVRTGPDLTIEQAEHYADHWQERIARTQDYREGTRAFAEKREPRWTGR